MTYLNRLHRAGIAFVSATEDFDFSTTLGKVILAVLGAIAEWYLDNLREETKKGKKARAKAGDWNGSLAFGYTTPRKLRKALSTLGEDFRAGKVAEEEYSRRAEQMEDTLEKYFYRHETAAIPDPFDAPGVVLAYTRYATGEHSDTDIAWVLNDAGYRTSGTWGRNVFGKDTILWVLQNRFYLGETSYQGKDKGAKREWIKGNHEPLISQDLFERCQEVRRLHTATRNSSESRTVAHYPLSGLLVCVECGTRWRGQHIDGQRRYRDLARQLGKECHQSPKSALVEVFEQDVEDLLFSFQTDLPLDWRQRALAMLAQDQPTEVQHQQQLARSQEALLARLERAKKLFVMGDLEEKEYMRVRAEIQGQMVPVPMQAAVADVDRVGAMLGDLRGLWEFANLEERKLWLNALFTTLYVHEGEIKAAEPTPTLWSLLQSCGITGNGCLPTPSYTAYTVRGRRAWNPHRPRRIYVEIEAISLRFSQSPGRVEPITRHRYREGSHDRQSPTTHSRTKASGLSGCSPNRCAIHWSAPCARTIRPSHDQQISSVRYPAHQHPVHCFAAGRIHSFCHPSLCDWLADLRSGCK